MGLFLITVFLANRLYTVGWLRMQSSGAPMEDIHERPGLFGRNSLDFMLGYKDWLLRVRDPRLLATLFSSVVLAVFFLFMAMRPGDDGTSLLTSAPPEDGSLDLLSPGIISSVLVFFLGYMAFTNMAMTALNIERQAFYVLKTAPISASRVFRAKTFGVFIPYAILTTVALAVFWIFLRFSLLWTPFAWIILMIAGYGLYTFLVSLSFLYPKLDWDDPRQMRNRKAGLPMLIGTTVYSLVILILAFGTYALAHGSPIWAISIVVMGLAIMGGGTWFFVHRITVRVEKSWPSIGIAN